MAAPSATVVAASPGEEHLAGSGSATVITIPAKIVSVNRGKKLLALEGSRGKQVTTFIILTISPRLPFVAEFYKVVTIEEGGN
jgi:hypothetical protein